MANEFLVARAFSPTNIALAKYWGKRDLNLNLPQNGSLSVTLDGLGSTTQVEFSSQTNEDHFFLNGVEQFAPSALKKVKTVLDILRSRKGISLRARVESQNNFPTGAGLASSASGLSALTLAASAALNLNLSKENLSEIARFGSGSACRSFLGGYVEWKKGEKPDGTDSVAKSVADEKHWPLSVMIIVINEKSKLYPSTDAMELTRETSPYFASWVEFAESQIPHIRKSIIERDFKSLAQLSEENCIKMHASAMAASPPFLYWAPQTLEVMKRVWSLRQKGYRLFFTIDAGPNVVIFSDDPQWDKIQLEFKDFDTIKSRIGEGAKIL